MSSYNTGSLTCKEIGCICATCSHRFMRFDKCITSCCSCNPDMPLESVDNESGEYGGIIKCEHYEPPFTDLEFVISR